MRTCMLKRSLQTHRNIRYGSEICIPRTIYCVLNLSPLVIVNVYVHYMQNAIVDIRTRQFTINVLHILHGHAHLQAKLNPRMIHII
jgi:hypothetical protein